MPEVLTYRCPFCDCDARVGKPCPGCIAKESRIRKTLTAIGSKSKPKSWEDSTPAVFQGEDFDYDEFCRREFGKSPHHRFGMKWYWWGLALIVLAGMIAGAFWLS